MSEAANTLPDDVSQLKGIIVEQILRHKEVVARKDSQIERLAEMVRLLRHQHFGRKSEKVEGPEQLGIFNEAEVETKEKPDPKVTVTYERRRGKPKRIAIPENFPREEVIVDLPEVEKRCPEGHDLKCIGEETSEQLDVIPAQVKVIRTIRKKYACPQCEGHVKRAPLPKTAIPKSLAGPGLLATIATSKYSDGLPLYRQEHMWQRLGVDIPRTTMASWMIKVGELLTPAINLMEEDLLEGGFVHADETRVQVLNEAGKLAESLSYMWVRGRRYPGAPPIVLFEYDSTRSGEVAKRLFEGYRGYLQADGYLGYNGVCRQEGVVRCGCMAHCRRKFFEAAKASGKGVGLANEAIEIIRDLYKIEDKIRDESIGERYRVRQAESKPVLDIFRKWLDDHLAGVPPKSQLGIALHYAHTEWAYLIRYLDDGRLEIDNNMVENAIRPFAVGRKNWLFSDSVAGAKASAAIYSVLVSAKLNGHNEHTYLRHLLEKLPLAETVEDVAVLLPHVLKPAKHNDGRLPEAAAA
jgi:transposase